MRSTCCRSTAPTRSGCRTSTGERCSPRCSNPGDHWAIPAHHLGGGAELLTATAEQQLEGLIAKRTDSLYRPGTRSKDWLKIKNRQRVEVTIGGFTSGTGARSTTFGSLLVGLPDDGGLRFVGGVGTGFDQVTLERLVGAPAIARHRDVPVRSGSPGSGLPNCHLGPARADSDRRDRGVHQRRPPPPCQLRRPRQRHDEVPMIIRTTAEHLDRDDPLARWRDEFVLPDPELIYLDGNSLGRTPKRTVDEVRRVIEEQWAGDLITSWWENGWLDMPLTVGDALAPLIGARSGEVAVHDSTTVCLFQLVNVGLDLTGGTVIAVAETEFPTDRYVIDGIARLATGRHGSTWSRRSRWRRRGGALAGRLPDGRTPRSRRRNPACASGGCRHRVGPVACGGRRRRRPRPGPSVDLAAGCTYKFLNGGPGAPAFTFVRSSVVDRVTQPIWGWFGQRDQFAMDNPFDPRPGIGKLLNGTPGILGLVAARCGIELSAEAGIADIAAKAHALSNFAIDLATELGLTCPTARPPVSSGGHVSILHPDATRLQQELASRKVIVDKRDPDVLRFGLSPLTTRFVDVHDALTMLSELP